MVAARFSAGSTERSGKDLALGVLRPLSRLVSAVLLAFHSARVTGDKTCLFEGRAKFRIHLHERTRNPVAYGPRLT